MRRCLVIITFALACGPAVQTPGTTGGSTSSAPPPGSTGSAVPDPTMGGTSTGVAESTTASSSGAPGSSTTGCVDEGPTVEPDPANPESRCLYGEFDCGCGYRCTTYAYSQEQWNQWANNGCFPVDPEHVELGDPCVSENEPWSGFDNCPAGAQCQDYDRDGLGTCKEFCDLGDPDFECADPEAVPYVACQDCGCTCEVSCDPRVNDCSEGEGCYLGSTLALCAPDASQEAGAFGDPCEFINACDPGLACLGAEAVPGCDGLAGCCTPFCDTDDPQCPEGTECAQIWEPGEAAVPILEGLGYCVTPGSFG
ncbi:MAG: hypothetical protein KUG77_25470 [Nannocystaceae bacterium]|nr:hypothetical protein [Nannocystaceae bacterium]